MANSRLWENKIVEQLFTKSKDLQEKTREILKSKKSEPQTYKNRKLLQLRYNASAGKMRFVVTALFIMSALCGHVFAQSTSSPLKQWLIAKQREHGGVRGMMIFPKRGETILPGHISKGWFELGGAKFLVPSDKSIPVPCGITHWVGKTLGMFENEISLSFTNPDGSFGMFDDNLVGVGQQMIQEAPFGTGRILVSFSDGTKYNWYPGGTAERVVKGRRPETKADLYKPGTRSYRPGSRAPMGGCFVTTATFGTPLATEVQTFRQFRDSYLLKCGLGRWFNVQYYQYGPKIAELVRQHTFLRLTSLIVLTPLAYSLRFFMWSPPLFLVTSIILLWSFRRVAIVLMRWYRTKVAVQTYQRLYAEAP